MIAIITFCANTIVKYFHQFTCTIFISFDLKYTKFGTTEHRAKSFLFHTCEKIAIIMVHFDPLTEEQLICDRLALK